MLTFVSVRFVYFINILIRFTSTFLVIGYSLLVVLVHSTVYHELHKHDPKNYVICMLPAGVEFETAMNRNCSK